MGNKIHNVVNSITGGRREQLSIANILQLLTAAHEKPVLGFQIQQAL